VHMQSAMFACRFDAMANSTSMTGTPARELQTPNRGSKRSREGGCNVVPQWLDSCSKGEASVLMFFLTRFLVGCALAFDLILSPFFRDFIQRLRPSFMKYMPRSTWPIRNSWLDFLYDHIRRKIQELHTNWKHRGRLRTLTIDGLKDHSGRKVNNLGDVIGGQAVFVDTLAASNESETALVIHNQVMTALRRSADRGGASQEAELTDVEVYERYAGVASDNTSAMRSGLKLVAEALPKLFTVGCTSHILDLLAEDIKCLYSSVCIATLTCAF